ncbi:hypothetical protein RB595_007205 [Gaeumannomyces hyphopodioides]
MRAVQTTSWEEGPRQVTLDTPPAPSESQLQLRMKYVGLHNVVRSRASGQHYSASLLPHTVGIDGVGVDEATGKHYFVIGMAPNFGTAVERLNIERRAAVPLPDGADAAAVAASVNPGMSSWLALKLRTAGLPQGFTALVLGATSASGELAVPLARALGAAAVVGAARNPDALARVAGLDRRVELRGDGGADTDWSGVLDDVDVVLDYISGDVAARVLEALPPRGKAVQFVQIGGLSGQPSVNVSGAALRSKNLTIRGSGPGAFSIPDMAKEMPGLVAALAAMELKKPQLFPLDEFEKVWADKAAAKNGRIVFTP